MAHKGHVALFLATSSNISPPSILKALSQTSSLSWPTAALRREDLCIWCRAGTHRRRGIREARYHSGQGKGHSHHMDNPYRNWIFILEIWRWIEFHLDKANRNFGNTCQSFGACFLFASFRPGALPRNLDIKVGLNR